MPLALIAIVCTILASVSLYSTTLLVALYAYIFQVEGLLYFSLAYPIVLIVNALLAKRFSSRLLKSVEKGNLHVYQKALRKQGFLFVFLLRLNPIFPFGVTNALASISNVPWPSFLGGSLAGAIPRTLFVFFLTLNLKDLLLVQESLSLTNSPELWVPLFLSFLGLMVLLIWAKRKATLLLPKEQVGQKNG